jgi:mono/diheme cytochrome c family protein
MNRRIGFLLILLLVSVVLSAPSLPALSADEQGKKPATAGEKKTVTPLEADSTAGSVPEILGMGAVSEVRIPSPSQYSAALHQPVKNISVPEFLIKAGDPRTVPDTDPNFKAGRELYNNTCARCHGVRGDGRGPEADGFLTPVPVANFMVSEDLVSGGYEYAYKRLNEGGRGAADIRAYKFSAMPSWQYDFTEAQKWQIILYLFKNAGIAPKNLAKSK